MKDSDYHKLIEMSFVGGGFIPINQNANDLVNRCIKGEIITFIEAKQRDIRFHRCYFSLLNFIYEYLPDKFKKAISRDNFYKWLKHLKGEYAECYTFKDGTKLIEYDSISFGKMSQKAFENYISEQLPFIYENVLGAFFEGEILKGIIETIEEQYQKFLSKL